MTVYELNRDQLEELKQNYLTENYPDDIDMNRLYMADDIVPDSEIYEAYAGTEFSNDDFLCSAGRSEYDSFHLEIDGDNVVLNLASDLREIADKLEQGYTNGMASYGTNWSIE